MSLGGGFEWVEQLEGVYAFIMRIIMVIFYLISRLNPPPPKKEKNYIH